MPPTLSVGASGVGMHASFWRARWAFIFPGPGSELACSGQLEGVQAAPPLVPSPSFASRRASHAMQRTCSEVLLHEGWTGTESRCGEQVWRACPERGRGEQARRAGTESRRGEQVRRAGMESRRDEQAWRAVAERRDDSGMAWSSGDLICRTPRRRRRQNYVRMAGLEFWGVVFDDSYEF